MGSSKRAYVGDAERLYVEEGKTCREVAAVLPITASTVGRWARAGDWDLKRQAYLASPKSALALASVVLSKKVAEIAALPPEAVDAEVIKGLTALVKAVDSLRKTWRPLELAVLAGAEFTAFVAGNVDDADLRARIFDVYSRFVAHVKAEG